MARAFLFVLDSVGIGGGPDAEAFGDTGSNTLGHIAAECAAGRADREGVRAGRLCLPNLERLGLGLAAFSVITNFGAGMTGAELSHGETKEMAPRGGEVLSRLLVAALGERN